jgi:hypothetical protein
VPPSFQNLQLSVRIDLRQRWHILSLPPQYSFCWLTRQPGLRGPAARALFLICCSFCQQSWQKRATKRMFLEGEPSKPPGWEFASTISIPHIAPNIP